MNVQKIIIRYLVKKGYDGLTNSVDACGCEVGVSAPCNCLSLEDCKPAYKVICEKCGALSYVEKKQSNFICYECDDK